MKRVVNTKELSRIIADELIVSEEFVSELITLIAERTTGLLKEGYRVRLKGIGTLGIARRGKRMVVNPQDITKKIKVGEMNIVKFKVSHTLKNRVKAIKRKKKK